MTSADLKCQVPVFVHPTSLNFYTSDHNSYKQIITLFNPYEFVIKFKGKYFFKNQNHFLSKIHSYF